MNIVDLVRNALTALNVSVTEFNLGYMFALMVIALTLLVLFIIRIILALIFRKKRCSKISIKSANGDAFISCTAIMSVIKALEKEFNALTINKVNLYRYGQKPFLEVYLDFDASQGGLPEHSERFKQKVIESLDKLFGIRNIKCVHLHLRNVKLDGVPELNPPVNALDFPKTTEIAVGPISLAGKEKKKEKSPEPVKAPLIKEPAALKDAKDKKQEKEEKPKKVKIEK